MPFRRSVRKSGSLGLVEAVVWDSMAAAEGVETAAPEHRDVEEDGMVAMKGHSVVARAAVARVEDLVLQLGVVADRAALEVVAASEVADEAVAADEVEEEMAAVTEVEGVDKAAAAIVVAVVVFRQEEEAETPVRRTPQRIYRRC